MKIFENADSSDGKIKYKDNAQPSKKVAEIDNIREVLAANKIFANEDIERFDKVNRYGFIDPYNKENVLKEFLIFTKPDLHLLDPIKDGYQLNPELKANSYIATQYERMPDIFYQLQGSAKNQHAKIKTRNPFMYLLTNQVTSKLDIPSISAESAETTTNIYGDNLSYRSHSIKSEKGFDFNLSFDDTQANHIYHMLKVYDEYMKMLMLGEIHPFHKYVEYNVDPSQFSIYKFLIGMDGETILYFAKVTGVYFTDVPRDAMNDPNDYGKISVGFHGQHPEDSSEIILQEFNKITPAAKGAELLPVYNPNITAVNNLWGVFPYIAKTAESNKRTIRRNVKHDYLLKWTKS